MSVRKDTYANIKGDIKPGDVIAFSGEDLISEVIKLVTGSKEVSHVGVVLPTNLLINGKPQDDCLHLVAEANASGVRIVSLCSLQSEYNGKLWWLPLSCESRQRLQPNLKCFYDFLLKSDGSPYDYGSAIMEGLQELIGEQNRFLRLVNWFLDRLPGQDNQGNFADLLIEDSELEDIRNSEDIRIKLVDWFIQNPELAKIESEADVKKYFCSELATDALQHSGVFGDIERIDPETVNPLELCQFALYRGYYVLLQSDDSDQPDEDLPKIEDFNTKDPSQRENA